MRINVKSHETELKELFLEVFSENSSFVELIFSDILFDSDCFAIKENNRIASFLYAIKKDVKIENEIKNCIYIYGVGTHKDYRKKGYMRMLLDEAYEYYKDKNIEFLYLVPANESLFNMYEKLGYKTSFYLQKKTVELNNPCDALVSEGDYYKDYKEFSKKADNIILMSENDIETTLKYTTYCKINKSGFLWEKGRDTAYIRECFLDNENDLKSFLKYLAKDYKTAIITQKGKAPYAMLKPYRNFSFKKTCYTNMNFD